MTEQNPILSNEKYIDLLTELVLEQEEENELSELTDIPDSEINRISDERMTSVWQKCRPIVRKSKNATSSKGHTMKVLGRMINIAACVVLLVCLAFPVVLASNAQLRKNVYWKMVVNAYMQKNAYAETAAALEAEKPIQPQLENAAVYPVNVRIGG